MKKKLKRTIAALSAIAMLGTTATVLPEGMSFDFGNWRDAGLDQRRYAGSTAGNRCTSGQAAPRFGHRSSPAVPTLERSSGLSIRRI